MAGFKKKLPMSAALRQGGEGTVAPPRPGGIKNLGATPKGGLPTNPGAKAMPKLPSFGKMPKVK